AVRVELVLVELLFGTALVSAPGLLEQLLDVPRALLDADDDRSVGSSHRPRGNARRRDRRGADTARRRGRARDARAGRCPDPRRTRGAGTRGRGPDPRGA